MLIIHPEWGNVKQFHDLLQFTEALKDTAIISLCDACIAKGCTFYLRYDATQIDGAEE